MKAMLRVYSASSLLRTLTADLFLLGLVCDSTTALASTRAPLSEVIVLSETGVRGVSGTPHQWLPVTDA